jgi:hypothetical protein
MAVVTNRFTSAIDFYKSHIPFQVPTGTFSTNKLSDMVFIDYNVPSSPIKINQTYGAEFPLEFTVIVKNETINISLEFEIVHEKYFNISTSKKFVVNPLNQQNILVTVDNSYVNTLSTAPINKTNFKILVKNLSSQLAYVPFEDIRLPRKSFDREITVS